MKKIIVLLMLVFIGASTTIYAQESKSESRRAERKAQRDAEKAREKIEEERAYANAAQAIKDRKFVLEADRVTFKRGRSAFVTSNTNFILLNGDRTVCSFHPASFNLSHFQLVVNLFVFEGQLFCFGKSIPVVGGRYGIDFITHTH